MIVHILASNPYFTCKGGCGSSTSSNTGLGVAALCVLAYLVFGRKKK